LLVKPSVDGKLDHKKRILSKLTCQAFQMPTVVGRYELNVNRLDLEQEELGIQNDLSAFSREKFSPQKQLSGLPPIKSDVNFRKGSCGELVLGVDSAVNLKLFQLAVGSGILLGTFALKESLSLNTCSSVQASFCRAFIAVNVASCS